MNFEEKLNELEEIVARLDDRNVQLKESTELYEKGVKLIKECLSYLGEAKGKAETIKKQLTEIMEESYDE